jgi:hypothetical protein
MRRQNKGARHIARDHAPIGRFGSFGSGRDAALRHTTSLDATWQEHT